VEETIEEKGRSEAIFKTNTNLRTLMAGSGKIFIDNE